MTHATHRQHMGKIIEHRPRFESRPYRMHPGRRAHIYGELQPIEADPKPWRLKLFVVFAIAVVMIGGSYGS